ncbi:MAG: hypothetical protein AAB462_01880 [Patescibacteria group bacterium]
MEGAPLFNQEDDSDDNPDVKPSRKSEDDKSKYTGIFSYEAKPPEPAVKPVEKIEKPEPKPRIAELNVAEIEPAPEAQAPLETLGEEEKPIIERELTIAAQEADPVQTPEQVTDPEQAAAEQAVEHFRDRIVEDGEDSDDAFRETLAELGAEEDEINDLVEEIEPSPDDEIEDEEEEESDVDAQELDGEELVIDRSGEDAPEDDEGTSDSAGADNGGSGSGSGQPPVVPPPTTPAPPAGQPPHGFGGGNGPNPPFGNGPQGGFNPNQTPPTPPVTPDAAPRVEVEYRGNPAAAALVGGVLGYLLGRRRGRIKTEKKLLPVQKKLEKQVNGLEFQLQEKEKTLRRVAAEKVRQQGPIVIERLTNVAEKAPKKQEHLGHVSLSAAEVEPMRHPEKQRSKFGIIESRANEKQAQPATGKRVENLSREELLRLSDQIVIEGTSLRQIYETHLINERGMRRIVAENLRGGDLSKALRREIVQREVDFERDPALRDVVPQVSGGGAHAGSKAALDKLLKDADVAISDGGEEAAFFRARANYEASQLVQHKKQRQLFNIGFTFIVAILITIILALFVSRG